MRINVTSVLVDDQEKASKFYTEVLRFVIKNDMAVVHMKLALVSLAPFGKEVIPRDMTQGRSVVVG